MESKIDKKFWGPIFAGLTIFILGSIAIMEIYYYFNYVPVKHLTH